MKLNDTTISSNNNTYSYRAYIENLMSFGGEAKKSQLTSSLFYADKGGAIGFEETHCLDPGSVNVGGQARYAHIRVEQICIQIFFSSNFKM